MQRAKASERKYKNNTYLESENKYGNRNRGIKRYNLNNKGEDMDKEQEDNQSEHKESNI